MSIFDELKQRYEPIAWERNGAMTFLSYLWTKMEPEYHVALTGSVLYRGWSQKDLDVIVYPRSEVTKVFSVERVRELLTKAGLTLRDLSDPNEKPSCADGPNFKDTWKWENRKVEIWQYEGKRVDIFYFNGDYKA